MGKNNNRYGHGRSGERTHHPPRIEKINLQGRRVDAIEKNLKPLSRRDIPAFMLYVNYAMDNLAGAVDVTMKSDTHKGGGTDLASMGVETFAKTLEEFTDAQWAKLADFLWAFRFNEPGRSFAADAPNGYDYRRYARKMLEKMYELRQFFDHCDGDGNQALICDSELYHFIEDVLRPEIERAASGAGRNPVKLLEKSLLSPHEVGEEAESISPAGRKYEFTWRGLVFFISLALYKDQAQEFLSCFKSFRLPNRRRDELDKISAEDLSAMKKKRPTAESFVEAFTYFSYRRGRVSTVSPVIQRDNQGKPLEVELPKQTAFRNFTNLMGYLNQVPEESFEYLELGDEWTRLSSRLAEELRAAAEHDMKPSAKNLRSRFDLACQIRQKDRFLSLAVNCCEQRKLLPCLHFKRLRWTSVTDNGQNQYAYDEQKLSDEERKLTGLNRHYVVDGGASRFEWRPQPDAEGNIRHHGNIKVKSLRGSIGEQEFCRLLALAKEDSAGVNSMLERYFSAYHHVLELMLNAPDKLALSLDNPELKAAVAEVIGVPEVRIPEHQPLIDLYFPANVNRFFVPPGKGRKREEDLCVQLQGKLRLLVDRCREFEERASGYEKFRQAQETAKMRGREGELPRVRRPSDGSCIARVFEWLNLCIENEDHRFRQLPFEVRHREAKFGDRAGDVGFQAAHKAIGLFGTDNKEVWGGSLRSKVTGKDVQLLGLLRYVPGLPRVNPENGGRLDVDAVKKQYRDVDQAIAALRQRVEGTMKRRPRRDAEGRPMMTKLGKPMLNPYSLLDLARAAMALCREEYERMRRTLDQGVDSRRLPELCRKADVRLGLPLEPEELRKSILGIADLKQWQWAFDVDANCPRVNARSLAEVEHVVSQIRVPNGIADRQVFAIPALAKRFVREAKVWNSEKTWTEPRVDWGLVFAQLSSRAIPLRKCYDVKPLLEYLLRPEAQADPKGLRAEVWNFASSGIAGLAPAPSRIWAKIQEVWRQVGYEPEAEEFEKAQRHWRLQELPAMDRKSVKRAICRIRTVYRQDVLLSSFAKDYWDEVKRSQAFEQTRTTFRKQGDSDVYEFFNAWVELPLKKTGVVLRLSRNDIFGMAFGYLQEHATDFAKLLTSEYPEAKDRTFLFDQVMDMFTKKQHQERSLRLEVLTECVRFMLGHPIASFKYRRAVEGIDPDDQDAIKQAIHQMELAEYRQTYQGFTEAQYRALGALRNPVIHQMVLTESESELRRRLADLRELLERAGIKPMTPPKSAGMGERKPHHGQHGGCRQNHGAGRSENFSRLGKNW